MTTAQELQFELMKRASFNYFDGQQVVHDLQDNRILWQTALMNIGDLSNLRHLPDTWHVDTLYITPSLGKEADLEQLAQTWDADEIKWVGGDEACKLLGEYSAALKANSKVILHVWWD